MPLSHGTLRGYSYYKCRCIACADNWHAYYKNWRTYQSDISREKEKARDLRSRQNNPERRRQVIRASYHRNKANYLENNRASSKRWYAADLTRARQVWTKTAHSRRSRKRGGTIEDVQLTNTYIDILYNDICAYCSHPMEHIEHIEPLGNQGDHHWSNLAASCAKCNHKKGTKSLLTFLVEGGIRHS